MAYGWMGNCQVDVNNHSTHPPTLPDPRDDLCSRSNSLLRGPRSLGRKGRQAQDTGAATTGAERRGEVDDDDDDDDVQCWRCSIAFAKRCRAPSRPPVAECASVEIVPKRPVGAANSAGIMMTRGEGA